MSLDFHPGMGLAVAKRTVAREENGAWESWSDVAKRLAKGNSQMCGPGEDREAERALMEHHTSIGTTIWSGRHLQHGDANQKTRPLDVFSNCATSAQSSQLFQLLLNGSGVGRSYDNDMMLVNWSNMPIVKHVIRQDHADVVSGLIVDVSEPTVDDRDNADRYLYVEDSREGWAKVVEILENMAFANEKGKTVVLDWSRVRPYGSAIGGMQNRPASGPGPLITALRNVSSMRDGEWIYKPLWLKTLFVDHYLAECVVVGGARRAARMSVKYWMDHGAMDFASVKNDHNLWSSNNSILVDRHFWDCVRKAKAAADSTELTPAMSRALSIFDVATTNMYRNGEPGFINVDLLNFPRHTVKHDAASSSLGDALRKVYNAKKYQAIVNPCAEIVLSILGGNCVIGDTCPFHAKNDSEFVEALKVMTRALIRTNCMSNAVFEKEIERTNRIGVGLTGFHEYARALGYSWQDLLNEDVSGKFWEGLSNFRDEVVKEAIRYSEEMGLEVPHTALTIKPAGTVSKLFGLTEGVHLPPRLHYLRWVQFLNGDPLVQEYSKLGYPTRELINGNATIVGFPTKVAITDIQAPFPVTLADEATLEEQYRFLVLLEKYWIGDDSYGNQISYTMKFDPENIELEAFQAIALDYQSKVKCATVMPTVDLGAYEYLPEEPIDKAAYDELMANITVTEEDIDADMLACASGACPVDIK